MGSKTLEEALSKYTRLALDSMVLIYLLEDVEPYASLVEMALQRVEKGRQTAYLSSLSIAEILVLPIRQKNHATVNKYRQFLTHFPNLHILPLDIPTAELAASMRAKYNLRTPDAIHVATAIQNGAPAFLTNDKQFSRVKELDILLLDSYR